MGDIILLNSDFDSAKKQMTLLARYFHWSRDEIWNLPILERISWIKELIDLEERERKAAKKISENPEEDLADTLE